MSCLLSYSLFSRNNTVTNAMSDTEPVAAPEVVEKKAPTSPLENDLTKYKVRKKSHFVISAHRKGCVIWNVGF